MMSQQEIHKLDLSGYEGSMELFLDILLSDLQEQIKAINDEVDVSEKHVRVLMMAEYLRGLRDGNRFGKSNPLPAIGAVGDN